MQTKAQPVSATIFPWLRANLGNYCLAPLTSTDAYALRAAVQIIELYAYTGEPEVITAFAKVVLCMQPKCRVLAYHAIAHVLDWHNRESIWDLACLPPMPPHIQRCANEPGGAR